MMHTTTVSNLARIFAFVLFERDCRMLQFLYLHRCWNFGKCDECHCVGLTLSSLVTLTIALDVQMQEQVVDKRWIIQNSVVPAWKQS